MRKFIFLIFIGALLSYPLSAGAEKVENPKNCQQCGMDRNVYNRSRILILYADGTSAGFCSLSCAAAEMEKNKGKQVTSVKVADYNTRELIEAKTAVWIVGGKIPGVMNSKATWAFAREEEALIFVGENGGEKADFEKAAIAVVSQE